MTVEEEGNMGKLTRSYKEGMKRKKCLGGCISKESRVIPAKAAVRDSLVGCLWYDSATE